MSAAPGARADRLTAVLTELELDALLVTDLVNIRYLTGFTGSSALVLIHPQRRVFVTDFRYVEQAAAEVESSFARVQASQDLADALPDLLPAGGEGEKLRLGFEEAHVSVRRHGTLAGLLEERASLVGVEGAIERLRAVKDQAEVAAIRAACELADEALRVVLGRGLIGRSETEVALDLENEMRRRGARRPSFDSIVAAGAHGALPHAEPRGTTIPDGELVVIDWGAELDGYCSDCTRTVATGPLDDQARAVYELVLAAQRAGVAAVRVGAHGREVDAVARDLIGDAGHGEHFGHGLGHGVGLEVHESPRLSWRSEDTLATGNVVSVEPGIYLPGRLGVRIEDLVVVREDGAEILTGLAKELITVS